MLSREQGEMKLLSKFSRLLPKRLRKSEEVFEEDFETPDVPEPPKDKQHDKNDKKINLKVTLLAAVLQPWECWELTNT